MASFHIIIALATLACFPSLLSAAELATEVCKNTTDFAFCRASVYSDERAATADRFLLINIIYRKAWANASDTEEYIASNIKAGRTESGSLEKCLANYKGATEELLLMLSDVNSESYNHLAEMSLEVEGDARDCKKVLKLNSIIYQRNENMLKLANICYVISKLFTND